MEVFGREKHKTASASSVFPRLVFPFSLNSSSLLMGPKKPSAGKKPAAAKLTDPRKSASSPALSSTSDKRKRAETVGEDTAKTVQPATKKDCKGSHLITPNPVNNKVTELLDESDNKGLDQDGAASSEGVLEFEEDEDDIETWVHRLGTY